jgi:uncharacterized repeat protein (TIGR01451 family)
LLDSRVNLEVTVEKGQSTMIRSKSVFSFKVGMLTFVGVFVLATGVLALAPRVINTAKSENCSGAPTVATLNPFPVSWAGTTGSDCTDAPAIAVRPVNSSAGSYSASLDGQSGEEYYIRIYVHNGAQQGLEQGIGPEATTIYGLNGNINISGGTVSTSFHGSRGAEGSTWSNPQFVPTNTVSGGVNINLPSGAHLELVPGSEEFYDYTGLSGTSGSANLNGTSGSFEMGEIRACFEFSKFLRFKVRVVGGQAPAPNPEPETEPSGSIYGQLDGTVSGQCLYYALVWWDSQHTNWVDVTVRNPETGEEVLFSHDLNKAEPGDRINWIEPNKNYRFTLWDASSGQRRHISETWIVGGNNSFCQAPAPVVKDFNFSVNAASICAVNQTIVYSITNATPALRGKEIRWTSYFNGQITSEIDAFYGHYVDGNGNWSSPSGVFSLSQVGNWRKVVSIDGISREVTFTVNNCSPAPQQPVCPSGNGLISFSRNPISVNETSQASAPAGWSGGSFSSNNSNVASVSGNIVTGRGAGTARITGTGFNVATSAGVAQNCSLTGDISINQPVVIPTLVCTPNSQTVNVNQSANFSASGGTGVYSWTAQGGSPASGSGASFNTAYSTQGGKTVTVTSGSQTVSCNVTVNTPVVPTLVCTPNFQEVNVDQPAFFTVSGGSGSYSWSAPGSTRTTGSGDSFNTAYATSGQRTVTVTSGSQTANCTVKVNQPTTPDLVCSPSNQTVNVDQFAFFSASGGNGSYSWTGGENPVTGSGNSYSTKFSSAGQKNVTVTSGSQSRQCVVTVNQPTAPGQPNLTITKEVRNLGPSQITGFSSSVNAKQNDTVQYRIVIRNTGTAIANEVFVSDNSQLNNTFSNLTVSKSYSGTIHTGLLLGNLTAGETVTITYNASVNIEQGNVQNVATVSATNVASRQAIALVVVVKEVTTTTGGECNNSTNSCNTNTNTTTQTNTNSTNSSNQSNSTNINGNNNTVTNTNQNCVNNSCNNTNLVYINNQGTTVPGNEFRQLSITKLVRNVNGGAFLDSVSVNTNDTVEFEIIVRNSGNQVVNNVQMTDTWNGNLSLVSGSVRVENSNIGDNLNSVSLGSILSGQQKRITFQARVNASGNQTVQNTARASGDNASQVQDDAWVFVSGVQGGNINLVYSKRANNDTKGTDATSVIAAREDYITYTLTVNNTGNQPATNFVITDDLSQVLPYADIVDNGGGTVSGNVISYPGITVPSGGSVSKSFRVRVKFHLANNLSYTMSNTYGNTIVVRINTPQVLGTFTAPKTGGPSVALASVFGSLMAGGMAVIRHRRKVLDLLWN